MAKNYYLNSSSFLVFKNLNISHILTSNIKCKEKNQGRCEMNKKRKILLVVVILVIAIVIAVIITKNQTTFSIF